MTKTFIQILVFSLLTLGCEAPRRSLSFLPQGFGFLSFLGINEHRITTIKEIHLDNSTLVEKALSVSGHLQSSSAYDTYLILSDSTGSILVDVTDLSFFSSQAYSRNARLNVIGYLEYGYKGLPVIRATEVRLNTDTNV